MNSKQQHVIWAMTTEDIEAAGRVLGRAFADEPIFLAATGSADSSLELCTETFLANFRHALIFGEAWAVGPDRQTLVGAAYTVLKPEPDVTHDQNEAFGYPRLMERWSSTLSQIGKMEEEAVNALGEMPATWRYLSGIGVDPEHQGSGYGSSLLGHLVERANDTGEVFGLITDRTSNVPFYERAGFRIVAEGDSVSGGIHYWSMVRNPG